MIRPPRADDAPRNLEIWREAVRATHDFLAPADLVAIDALVSRHLSGMVTWVFTDATDRPIGFLAITGPHIDALFVDPLSHGIGVGRALVGHARAQRPDLTVDVNEQNPLAIGFYKRLGFRQTGRSPIDDQGRPYPLLHMALPA